MDKNMINIDDLLKQRLMGGEEEERPGAWLKMRELLDEKMPEKVAAVYNWRRMLTYAAGLLLVATATVGSYTAYNSFRDGGNVDNGNGITATGTRSAAIGQNDKAAMVASADGSVISSKDAGRKMAGMDGENVSANTTSNPETKRNNSANNYAANVTAKRNKTGNSAALEMLADVSNEAGKSLRTNRKSLLNGIRFAQAAPLPVSVDAVASAQSTEVPAFNAPEFGYNETPGVSNMNNNNGTNDNNVNTPQAGNTVANNNNVGNDRPKIGPGENPKYKKEQKVIDSAEAILVKESTKRGVRRVDSIPIGKMARETYVALPAEDLASNANPDILPAAGMNTSAENKDLAPLKDFRTSSKKQHYAKANSLEEVIRNARINLSGVTLRPGLVLGVSSSTGNYNMMGVQFGFAGIMTMSEKWSMFAELKYIYRFGNGKSMTNQYNQLMDSSIIAGTTKKTYEYEDRTNYYEFATNSSLELPIALRYSIRRVNVFGGINTAYHFAMNPSPRDEVYKKELVGESGMSSQLNSEWKKDAKISYADFGSKLNVGALLGVGYQVTPAIGVDLRATQSVWDNVRTRGALQVSKYLYRTTNFQVNFTWRFGDGKYKRPMVR